jgi:hypothetical protein
MTGLPLCSHADDIITKQLKIGFLNIQGLPKKCFDLEIFSAENNLNVICLIEHWSPIDEINHLTIDGFYLGACYSREQHIRGGVAIYLKKSIHARALNLQSLSDEKHFEVTAVFIDSMKLIIVSLYRSPSGDSKLFLEKLEILLNLLSRWDSYFVVFGGDLNAEFDITSNRRTVGEFLNILRQFNFRYVNAKPTRGTACLDNVFTNLNPDSITSDVLSYPLSDHDCVYIKVKESLIRYNSSNLPKKIIITRPITTARIESFKVALSQFRWENLQDGSHFFMSSTDMIQNFFQTFIEIYDLCISKKEVKIRTDKVAGKPRRNSSWYTPYLSQLKNTLMLHRDLYKHNNTDQSKAAFLKLRKEYKMAVINAKKQSNMLIIESSNNKCKAAWSVMKSASNNKISNNVKIDPDDFNNYFITSIDDIVDQLPTSNVTATELLRNSPSPEFRFRFGNVTSTEVLQIVKKFKSSSTPDAFGLTADIIKDVIPFIVYPLTKCINCCLLEGIFPPILKLSRVVPIYKKGDRGNPSSFRPISVVPIFSKIIESVVKIQLHDYLNSKNLLSDSQFGFRTNKSTTDAVGNLVRDVYEVFEEGGSAQATFCDLSRAFDCVDHSILLDKLSYYGIRDRELCFFSSYLENRKQFVSISGTTSKERLVKYGVPQGSVLGPTLFLLIINDLPKSTNAKSIMYADDATFLVSNKCMKTLQQIGKNVATEYSAWFEANKLLLNCSKTQTLVFGLRELAVRSSPVKFLGIFVDGKLCWDHQIDHVCSRLSRILFLLRTLNNHVPESYVRSAYFAFFHSVMCYGLLLWGCSSRLNNVLLLQKKAVRSLAHKGGREHCKPLFISLRILSVVNVYILQVLLHTKKRQVSLMLRRNIHGYSTRQKELIDVPFCRLKKTKDNYLNLGIGMFNMLPGRVKDLPYDKFRKSLSNWLLATPLYSVEEFRTASYDDM